MKIDSTKNFLQKAYGIIEFDGSGSADGATTRDGKLFPLKGAGLYTEIEKGNYIVIVKTAIGDMRIPLNKVTNQETWLNTAEGRDKAWSDIVTWIKECEEVTSTGASEITGIVEVSNLSTTFDIGDGSFVTDKMLDTMLYPRRFESILTAFNPDGTINAIIFKDWQGNVVFYWQYTYTDILAPSGVPTTMQVIIGDYPA